MIRRDYREPLGEHRYVRFPDLFDALALRVATVVFLCAVVVDLMSKEWAVADQQRTIVFNHRSTELPFRVLVSLLTVAISLLIARTAMRRGLGRQWGVWIGCSLLVAGILANGISPLLWARGVPDFIHVRNGWFWNVADFEIAIGLTGGLLSVVFNAVVVYTSERVVSSRGEVPPDATHRLLAPMQKQTTTNAQRESWIVLGCAVLYLVVAFLQWQHFTVKIVTTVRYGFTEWNGVGRIACGLVIGLLLWEVARLFEIAPQSTSISAAFVSLALAVLLLLFTALTFVTRSQGRQLPAWLGLGLSIVIAVAAVVRAKVEGVEMLRVTSKPDPPTR